MLESNLSQPRKQTLCNHRLYFVETHVFALSNRSPDAINKLEDLLHDYHKQSHEKRVAKTRQKR